MLTVKCWSEACVAAAYEAAAKYIQSHDQSGVNCNWRGMADAIRDLTPAEAQSALDKMLAEARLEGWRAGREAAAIAARGDGESEFFNPVQAIRDMPEPKETHYD